LVSLYEVFHGEQSEEVAEATRLRNETIR